MKNQPKGNRTGIIRRGRLFFGDAACEQFPAQNFQPQNFYEGHGMLFAHFFAASQGRKSWGWSGRTCGSGAFRAPSYFFPALRARKSRVRSRALPESKIRVKAAMPVFSSLTFPRGVAKIKDQSVLKYDSQNNRELKLLGS